MDLLNNVNDDEEQKQITISDQDLYETPKQHKTDLISITFSNSIKFVPTKSVSMNIQRPTEY